MMLMIWWWWREQWNVMTKNLASIFSSIAEPQLADLQVKTVAPVYTLINTYGDDLSVWFGNDDNHNGDTLRVWVQILHPFEQADFPLISPSEETSDKRKLVIEKSMAMEIWTKKSWWQYESNNCFFPSAQSHPSCLFPHNDELAQSVNSAR